MNAAHEREIYDKLSRVYFPPKDGLIRRAYENDLPCFEYFLSNLYLVPDSRLSSLTCLILNFSKILIKRGRFTIGEGEKCVQKLL